MKYFSRFLLILIGISCLNAQDAKKAIAVLDLDPSGIAPTEVQFLTARLRTELFETGAFQVVEREKMNAILNEQGFQRTGCTTVECAVEIGQLLNVKNIVAGSIGKIEELYSISLRMIDVQTGAIVKTATRDYRGKLSEVLTEVIPEIAEILAKEEKTAVLAEKPLLRKSAQEIQELKKFGIILKAGYAFLGYTSDANKAIDEFKDPYNKFNKYSNHRNLVLEINYSLSTRWQVKLNYGVEKILDNWTDKGYLNSVDAEIESYTQNFKFTNLGLGINYYLLKRPAKFDWYVGSDLGPMGLEVHVTTVKTSNEVFDKRFTYNTFAIKLTTGCGYFLIPSLRVGIEFALQASGNFDLTNQPILPPQYTEPTLPDKVREDIMLLNKISGTGIQINTTLSYHL
jgi:TolB-like protein